jgi:fructosamine-3-kinase
MTQTTAEQRAELRRLVDAQEINAHYRSDYPEHAAMVALLNAGPALLADAEALAAIEAAGEVRRARVQRVMSKERQTRILSEAIGD